MNEEQQSKHKQVVLIADDSSTVRKFVTFSLASQSLEVVTAVDGMDALEKISQIPQVDLIIVDLNMPNMDGFEFIQNVRGSELHRDVPIIILSSERGEESKQRGIAVGANAYIEKPFDAKNIEYQVSKFLDIKKKPV
ncbi:MAG: response regulator [Candidatus Marinimicrobia bacterium]|nr:response regulator [Candidatus Neomarinimicrobiota bacterium]MCH8836331.1 response regulator [Candidatus Neomarinimicrobiota bacterium]